MSAQFAAFGADCVRTGEVKSLLGFNFDFRALIAASFLAPASRYILGE
jgi:hypothetical protein